MKKNIITLIAAILVINGYAQIPGTLAYQGIVLDALGNPVGDGEHQVRFSFYSSNNPDATPELTRGALSVQTARGYFNVIIGDGTGPNNAPLPSTLGLQQYWIGVTVDEINQPNRVQLTSVPYAFNAFRAQQLDAGGLISGTIPDDRLSIHLRDLSDGELTGTKVGDGINGLNLINASVTGLKLADNSVTNLKIAIDAVDNSKLSDGAVGTAELLDNAVTNNKLAADAVDNTKLADNAVTTAEIADGVVTNSKLATGIDASKITTGSLPSTVLDANLQDLADGMLSGSKIGSGINFSNVTASGANNHLAYWTNSSLAVPSELTWDNTTRRMGIGATSTSDALTVATANNSAGGIVVSNNYGLAASQQYGLRTNVTGAGNPLVGTFNSIVNNGGLGSSVGYGSWNNISVGFSNTTDNYGSYNVVSHNGNSGRAIGVHSAPTKPLGKAGDVYGFYAIPNNNGMGITYMFRGETTGDAASEFGLYIQGEDRNYLSGDLGIGISSASYKLHVVGTTYLNGTPYSGQSNFTVVSDARTKKNIASFSDGLSTLLKINPVKYFYNGLGGSLDNGEEKIGVIAQDILPVAPYMVKTEMRKLTNDDEHETEMLVYNSSALSYVLVNAVKEQQKQITELQNEIEKLKGLILRSSSPTEVTASKASK